MAKMLNQKEKILKDTIPFAEIKIGQSFMYDGERWTRKSATDCWGEQGVLRLMPQVMVVPIEP